MPVGNFLTGFLFWLHGNGQLGSLSPFGLETVHNFFDEVNRMITTTQLKLDIAAPAAACHIWAKQGDTNSRSVALSLYENGSPWTIPAAAAAVIRYQCLPDGCGGIYDTLADGSAAWSVSGNEIRVILVPQMLSRAGGVLMDVALTEGDALLATCNIHIHVEGSPREGAALEQADYFNLAKVTAVYQKLNQAISNAASTALLAVPEAVDNWMAAHPEVTTTLQPGAVTPDMTSFIHYNEYRHPDTQVPDFINQIPLSTDAGGSTLGWETDKQLSTYTGATSALAGYDTTGFIPLSGAGDVLRLANLRFFANQYCRIAFYQADKTFIGAVLGAEIAANAAFAGGFTQDDSGNFTVIDLTGYEAAQSAAVVFMRLCAHNITDSAILTVNEEITYTTIPGAVDLIDLELEDTITVPQAAQNRDDIAALAKRVATLEARFSAG